MSNDNLKNIYNALVTPSPQTNNKPLFTKDEIGATPEEFAKIMSNSENAKNIYTALTSPIASLGNKPIFTSAEIGDNADAFSSILGIQKKSPIGSVSTSGSEPFQNTSTIVSQSPIKTPKVSIGSDVKNAIISLEGAQMALVNKDKEIHNLDKSLSGGRDIGGSFLQQDKNLAKVTSGYKEELTKERQFIEKSVSGVISRVKPLINKITDEAITKDNLSGFTKNIEGKIIPDPLKIREYVDDVIAQTGLSEGKYVKDFIYNEVKANVQSKISQPKIEKKFEEIYKSKYGISPEEAVNKDFAGKFKDDESLQAQAKLKAKEASSLAQTDFNIEMSKYSEEYKKKADAINLNYNTQADNIKKTAEGLGAQYSNGQISKEQYEVNINQLNIILENSFNAYKDNFKLLADEFLKTQNATASRYDRRLQRQYAEIDNSYQTELKNRLKNYQSKYIIPSELKKRYEETYREATQLYNKEEAVADYAVNTYKGGVVTFGESLLSGLGQGIKELSYMADFDLGKKYGEFLETSFRLSESNLESMKDLLDPIKLARSSGQTIGAMTPMIIGNAGIAAATGGASIPVQLAMTGGFGFVMETMQMAGSTYDRKLAETGVVADAEKAAAKVIKGNTMLMPLYAFDGLPLINNATLGIKNRALRALAKGGIETITEFTQEIPQSAIEDVVYKNQNLTDVVDKFDLTKAENRKEIFNTALNVIPASMLMGSAPTFLGYANKPINEIRGRAAFTKEKLEGLTDNALEQFFYDMQLTKGATFTKAFLSGAYASGSVNEMQLIKLTNIVDKSAKVMEDAKALKLSNGESKVYAAYEFAADAYTKQADQMEEGVVKDALLSKAAKAKKEAQEFLTNKKGDYVVLIMPNGEQYVYQSDFFVSSTDNYKTLRKLIIDGNATAYAVASTKEGELIKTKVTGLLKIADKKLQENDSKPSVVIDEELFDKISEEIGVLQLSLEQPSLSPESKQKIQVRITELEKQSEMVLKGEEVEYVSEGDNFFKILLDGTKEPISEQEFDQAVETVKPINEKNGEIVTVNIGGKAITGTVEVDEGGKATIYLGGTIYELPNDTQYADYASPVRISDIDGSIEFDGISYPEVRIETVDGNETAVLIDEAGKPKTVKDPAIVEEFKYQITLANLQELTEPEAITLLLEYENSKGKTDAAAEEGASQTNEQTEQDIKLQEAIDEIDLIELIALEELENAESEAKLVSYKPVNSKEEKVYLVKKNADGTISATLNGRNVKRPDVLRSIADAYEIQSKEQSKKLVAKLQDQTNKLKAEVEERLFGKKAETVSAPVESVSAPVTEVTAPAVEQVAEQPVVEEQAQEVEQEPQTQTQERNATQESSQQVTQGGEQGDQLQRERTDEGQQKTGERKRSQRKAEKQKTDDRSGDISGKEKVAEQPKAEKPKVEAPKPVGLTANETKYKENPDALSKDELKDVLSSKRERLKKANAALEKGELSPEETKVKQKAIDNLENTIEDLVKRIDSKSNPIATTKEQLAKVKKEISDYWDGLSDNKLGIAKTPEQMVQSMREDEKFFRAIVDFAYLSIKLKGLKTIEAFKTELEKQLGVKFDKLPQELKDAWAQAKVMVSTEKKQAPTVKQTIKEGAEQGTSKEKIATFAEYMAAKYKGMAEGEKIGQKNRFEIIKEAAKYVKQAVSSDISRAKINSLINKAINIQNFDSVKSFAKYVDKLIENQEYYAKVAELEALSAKVGKALRNDKFGSIVPQITRLLSINPENLTENGIDKYISLAKELLNNKVADVTNLESTLTQLKAEERTFIEGKLASDLMSDRELVDLLDKIDQLSKEERSDILDAADKRAAALERQVALDDLTAKLNKKRSEIMEYASGDKVIANAKDYASLISAIKKYNANINQMVASEFISEGKAEIMLIDLTSKELSLLEESLKEKLSDFRKSLTDQVKNIINSIKNQYNTGGLRARLFENLSDFDKKIYDPIIKDVLTIPLQTLPDLDIADLNTFFNAVEQLNNGYISPKLLESIEIIEAKAYQNTIAENANKLYDKQVDADGVYKEKLSPIASSVGSFSSWSELADFMKTFNYQDIKTAFTDGYAQIFGEYILTPVQKALVRYKILLEDTISPVIKADDNLETFFNVRRVIGKPSTANLTRNVLGIFFVQADHFRHEDFNKWTDNQKNLAKYLIDEYDNKNLNVSKDRMKLLKAAYNEIEGDISTKEGLKSAMDKYFSKNKKAKDLFYAIRNSIDNEVALMNKVSIERDGGYFEQDQDYFQWQRAGEDVKGMESTFQDAIAERYDKDFKRKANATYKRKGSPFFMREFNATRAYYKMAEEAAINYEVEPVIIPFQKAVRELANKYKLAGKKDLAMFLQASNEYVFFSAKLMFEKYQSTFFNKAYSDAAAFVRRYRLGNIIRTSPDLLGTEAKLLLSMNPAEYAKYLTKQAREFNEDSFIQLAKLVSSPIEFKTTRANVENMQFNKPNAERRIDALTGLADRIAQTNAWKAFMMANFKKIKTELYNKKKDQVNEILAEIKITNDDYKKNQLKETLATYKEELLKLSDTELDVKKMQANPIDYYAENKYVLDKAAFLSDQQIDTYTVNQFQLGRAPMVKVLPALTLSMLPFVSKEKAIKMLTVKRNSKSTIYLNFMGSYTGTEANLMSSAFQKILVQKNYVEGFRDIGSIMTSQFVYMSAMAAANAIASIIGFAVTNVFDGDDEDEYEKILEFAKKEWEEFSELYQDPIKLMQTYALTLALTPLAKYPTLSRSAVGFAVGLWSGAEIGSAQNKAEIKEAKSKWVDRYKVIQDKLYVNPIPFGVKDPELTPTWGEYANMLDPISGFYLKLADDQLNPKKQGNLVELVREINKDGEASNNKMLIAGANLFMLGSIGYGSLFAPTYIKIMNENAKSQIREDIEKKKSKGTGKRNDGFGGFGSDGFSSSKF